VLLLAYTSRLDEAVVATVGVLAAVLLFGLHLAYEHWRGGDAVRLQQDGYLLVTADRLPPPHSPPGFVDAGLTLFEASTTDPKMQTRFRLTTT
jgi:hypothetical protein